MSPSLLAALINTIALPEITIWLRSLHASDTPVTDDMVLAKLQTDAQIGPDVGLAWLAAHPDPA